MRDAKAVIVVEDDVFSRLIQVVCDPRTSPERLADFSEFMAHDEPDFAGWCRRLRREIAEIVPSDVRFVTSQDELREALPDATAAVVESLTIGKPELDVAPLLRVVQKFGVVTRNIDVEACAERGVQVRTQRRRSNTSCAEYVIMMMLALSRKLLGTAGRISPELLAQAGYTAKTFAGIHTARNNWGRIPGLKVLYESTLGLIGFGEIGREIATRAAAFGMDIVYSQRTRASVEDERAYGVRYESLEGLLAQSDFVSIQLPAGAATHNFLDRERLALVKPGAFLINVARAELIERDALLEALDAGRLGGFALDPLYEAPGRSEDPLLQYDNVVLTPHIAAQPRFNALNDMVELLTGLRAGIVAGSASAQDRDRAVAERDDGR
ncbi:MAG: NAD(P)-dependent oxidoreductase [Vulcanimicrobiaceae bacterium]